MVFWKRSTHIWLGFIILLHKVFRPSVGFCNEHLNKLPPALKHVARNLMVCRYTVISAGCAPKESGAGATGMARGTCRMRDRCLLVRGGSWQKISIRTGLLLVHCAAEIITDQDCSVNSYRNWPCTKHDITIKNSTENNRFMPKSRTGVGTKA